MHFLQRKFIEFLLWNFPNIFRMQQKDIRIFYTLSLHLYFLTSFRNLSSFYFDFWLSYLNRFIFQSPKVEGDEWRKASTDVVIAGLGWISITGKYIRCRLCHGCMLWSCVCGLIFVCVCVNVNAVFTSVLGFSLMMTL